MVLKPGNKSAGKQTRVKKAARKILGVSSAEYERITQEMYRQNFELAEINKTLSLLRQIDLIVLEPNHDLASLCAAVSGAIINSKDYSFVAIYTLDTPHSHIIDFKSLATTPHLASRLKDLEDIAKGINFPTNSSLDKTDFSVYTPEEAKKYGVRFNKLIEATSKAFLMAELKAQKQQVGTIVIGLRETKEESLADDYDFYNRLLNAIGVAIDNKLLVEENKRVVLKLEHTNEKLKALDEAKDEFISMASHQLRTPLTSMKGYVSMVLDGDTGDVTEQQRMMLQQAFDSSQRMVYLISDLLNVSRLKTGKFVIENVRTNLANVVESEISQIHEAVLARGLELNFDKPHDFPEFYLDETKTRQVIMNFIDNAMYYTPKDGKIDVKLHVTDKSLEFTVNDTGVGVSPAEQKHLFTKFYRAQNARKMRPDGTGLGLYMAQKIIIAQGGAIIFKSKLGEGSTFGFSFPLEKIKLPAEAASLPGGNSTN